MKEEKIYKIIAKSTPKLERGLVQCRKCKKIIKVDSAEALRVGWPTCHEYTMTLDVDLLDNKKEEWEGCPHRGLCQGR